MSKYQNNFFLPGLGSGALAETKPQILIVWMLWKKFKEWALFAEPSPDFSHQRSLSHSIPPISRIDFVFW